MKTEWAGYYLDGKTAGRKQATVRIMRLGLHIDVMNGESLWWPHEEIRQTQGFYPGEQVRLERGGEISEAVLITDDSFLINLQQIAPQWAKRYHSPPLRARRVARTVYAAVGAVGIVAALYFWGIPALATLLVPYVPISWEERLGESVVQYLAPKAARCSDSTAAQMAQRLVAQLTASEKQLPYKFHVLVIDNPNINAMAVPGGTIVLFRGLVEKTASPEELAGVLAHELQHILRRHSMHALIQHLSTSYLLALIAGDANRVASLGSDGAKLLGGLRYSRLYEEEADAKGVEMLMAAGVKPDGMISFYETMAKEGRDLPEALQFLSTHPATEDRIHKLKSLGQKRAVATTKLIPAHNWVELKKKCNAPPATNRFVPGVNSRR